MPWKNSHEMNSAEPNDEAEETYDVHNGEPADAFFHTLTGNWTPYRW